MEKFYLLILVVILGLPNIASAQLKSVSESKPVVDTSKMITITEPWVIANADDDTPDNWFIYDGDPKRGPDGEMWNIAKNDGAVWDNDDNGYVTQLIGHRKSNDQGSEDYNNYNQFALWSPTDSGVPWNVRNSVVSFKVKILSDHDKWPYQVPYQPQMAIIFFVAMDYGKNVDFGPFKIMFVAEEKMKPQHVVGEPYYRWWEYFPTGLGTDLADGNWHTFEFDLIKVLETFKQQAIDDGETDSKLGSDSSEGVNWNWYGILSMNILGNNVMVDDVKVLPKLSTGISGEIFEDKLSVYPNPSSGIINLSGFNNLADVAIYNIAGSKVYTNQNLTSGSQINVSDLTEGVYLLKVNDGKQSRTRKIIIK